MPPSTSFGSDGAVKLRLEKPRGFSPGESSLIKPREASEPRTIYSSELDQCCVDDKAKGGLMLAGNPLPSTGNQVEEDARLVSKYCLQGGFIWRVVLHIYNAEMQWLFPWIDDHDAVSDMKVSQVPEDGG